jgi:hypothetical protein
MIKLVTYREPSSSVKIGIYKIFRVYSQFRTKAKYLIYERIRYKNLGGECNGYRRGKKDYPLCGRKKLNIDGINITKIGKILMKYFFAEGMNKEDSNAGNLLVF